MNVLREGGLRFDVCFDQIMKDELNSKVVKKVQLRVISKFKKSLIQTSKIIFTIVTFIVVPKLFGFITTSRLSSCPLETDRRDRLSGSVLELPLCLG